MKLKKIVRLVLFDIPIQGNNLPYHCSYPIVYFRKSEGIPTSSSSADLSETASLPLVIKEKDVEYQVNVRFVVNVLKFRTFLLFCSQINSWFPGMEFTKWLSA